MSGITCGASMSMGGGGGGGGDEDPASPTHPHQQSLSPATQVLQQHSTNTANFHNHDHAGGYGGGGGAARTILSAAQQQAQMLQKSRSDDLHKVSSAAFATARTASTEASSVMVGPSTSTSSSSGSHRYTSGAEHDYHHNKNNHNSNDNNSGGRNKPPRYNHQGIPISRSQDSHSHHSRVHNKLTNNNNINAGTVAGKHLMGSSHDYYDHDHHTFATATTASATISYSTDEVDHVDSNVSEAGMEVVMDENTTERMREEQILSLLSSSKDHSNHNNAAAIKEPPYVSHSFPAGKHTFTVDQRYSLIRVIGSGAYGVVISAKDGSNDTDVAIKMVPKAFHDEVDAKRILREIKLLKHFRHENIVGLIDMMPPSVPYVEDYHDVYMVTDLMETDLHRIIYSKQKLSLDHVQYFVYQILRGLKYIHSCNVLHRDLKPSNLLVNSNCDLKICDFGLARGIYDGNSPAAADPLLLTEYVVTRWYRAPEIMLACHEYSKPIDVWSVGCIFAELILRKPYFPGDDYIDQLTIISEKLGKLSDSELDFVTSDKAKRFMKKLPNKPPVPLGQQFPSASPDALDLLRRMLSIHPKKRITVEEALAHPFFRQLHSPEDEPVCDHGPFDFRFEDDHLHRKRLQELIWREVGDFRPSVLPVKPSRSSMMMGSNGNLELSVSRSRSNRSRDP